MPEQRCGGTSAVSTYCDCEPPRSRAGAQGATGARVDRHSPRLSARRWRSSHRRTRHRALSATPRRSASLLARAHRTVHRARRIRYRGQLEKDAASRAPSGTAAARQYRGAIRLLRSRYVVVAVNRPLRRREPRLLVHSCYGVLRQREASSRDAAVRSRSATRRPSCPYGWYAKTVPSGRTIAEVVEEPGTA
jgi:hypothetical protein